MGLGKRLRVGIVKLLLPVVQKGDWSLPPPVSIFSACFHLSNYTKTSYAVCVKTKSINRHLLWNTHERISGFSHPPRCVHVKMAEQRKEGFMCFVDTRQRESMRSSENVEKRGFVRLHGTPVTTGRSKRKTSCFMLSSGVTSDDYQRSTKSSRRLSLQSFTIDQHKPTD